MKYVFMMAASLVLFGCEQPTDSDQWADIRPLANQIQAAIVTAQDVEIHSYTGALMYQATGFELNLRLDLPFFLFSSPSGTTAYSVDLQEVVILEISGNTLDFKLRNIDTP